MIFFIELLFFDTMQSQDLNYSCDRNLFIIVGIALKMHGVHVRIDVIWIIGLKKGH